MTEPKTAQQHNSQVVGTAWSELPVDNQTTTERAMKDSIKLKVSLRLLVERWRDEAKALDPVIWTGTVATFCQCAKELEEALK